MNLLCNNIEQRNEENIDFIEKMNLCKYNSYLSSFNWIRKNIMDKIPVINIAEKYLDIYQDLEYYNKFGQKSTCYELFEAFYLYKNNLSINYKLARYLKHCIGIISSGCYFDDKYKFIIVFFSVKDIIKELDGNGFFIWLDNMCNCIY
jgi:hypothetical protein